MCAQSGVRRFGGESRPDRFGVPIDAGEGVGAEFLLGRKPQCIVVAQDRVVQLSRAGCCLPAAWSWRERVRSVALEDLRQDVDRGRRADRLRVDEAVGVIPGEVKKRIVEKIAVGNGNFVLTVAASTLCAT